MVASGTRQEAGRAVPGMLIRGGLLERRDLLETLVGLHEAGRVMGSTLDGAEIGHRMLEILERTLGVSAAALYVPGDAGGLRALVSRGLEGCSRWRVAPEEAEAVRSRVLETEQRQTLRLGPDAAGVFMPLCSRSRAVGVLEAYEAPRDRASLEFLSSLCVQAATALDNSRLYERVLEHEQTLRKLVDRMVRVQEDERRRVAHEIHDGLTQSLIAVNHHLEAFSRDFMAQDAPGAERLERILELSRGATEESRRITFGLRPTVLEDFGVAAAIRSEVETLAAQGFAVSYTEELAELRLPEAVETTLYRVAQEALSNARKHAGVESAAVSLQRDESEVRLRIADRGRGFDPGEASGGLGLVGMRERVELIGGSLELESAAGRGTEVSVAAPIPGPGGERHG